MSVSKKLTLAADGLTATVADATIGDIFTSVIDTNVSITGMYGLTQKVGLVISGMAVQNWRLGAGLNPFKSA